MKIRKGFVTNSSSTNFGTMLVTSLGSIGIASILNIFNIDMNAKKKSYVRLVVEAPTSRILKPGDAIAIRGEVVKLEIIDGEVSGEPVVVAAAVVECIEGAEVLDGNGSDYYVTTDENRMKIFKGSIRFLVWAEYEGEKMSANIDFSLASFNIEPAEGIFVVSTKNEEKLKIYSNAEASFSDDIATNILQSEIIFADNSTKEMKLIENVEEPEKLFNKYTCGINKRYKVRADYSGAIMEKEYTARILCESILVPKQLKEPIVIKCYSDKESDKRQSTAFELPIKVVVFDSKQKKMVTDVELTNNLEFEVFAKSAQKHINNEQARKAITDAQIVFELVPNTGAATDTKPYARYRIYSNALAEAETDKVEIGIRVTCKETRIGEVMLNGTLFPRIDLKGLIKQFIAYPSGTFVASQIKLGDVDIYMEAIDFLTDIKMITSGNPRFQPGENAMYLYKIPEGIHEFAAVQTIHHELAHAIEEQHGDEGGTTEWDERHSYYIENLSNVCFHLANLERGNKPDIENAIGEAIIAYDSVYFNFANLVEPANVGEIISWFGVKAPTQHQLFGKYASFEDYNMNSSLSEEMINKISKAVRRKYFPGNVMGRWQEKGGLFDGMNWRISWSKGELGNLIPESTQYSFKEMSRSWSGGSLLRLEVRFFVTRLRDNDEDELIAIFDAGSFDSSDYHYPAVSKMSVKWMAGRTLSDCILGDHRDKVVQLEKK